MTSNSPAALRVVLGRRLRALREASGLKPADVAQHFGWHASKLSRVEQGVATTKASEIEKFLTLYQADAEAQEEVRGLGAGARSRGSFGKVPDWARQYLGLELDAARLEYFNGELLPGLIQTERYARAIVGTSVVVAAADIERVVEARMRRQEIWQREPPPEVHVILDEAAIRRQVGSA